MKIAILLDAADRAASLKTGGMIYVFERMEDNWVANRRMDFIPGAYQTMGDLRGRLGALSEWLGDCRVLAARPANGFYRVVFESYRVALWGVAGPPQSFIEQIEGFYTDIHARTSESEVLIRPIAHRAGHYRVDLRGVMGQAGAHSSRQVLIPFFQEASFVRLEITCDHVPKWFARELPAMMLKADVESNPGGTKVHVYPVR